MIYALSSIKILFNLKNSLSLSLSLYINVCITFFIHLLLIFVRDEFSVEISKIVHEQIMSDEEEQNYFIPHRRTFHIQSIPQWKISLLDEKSKLEINRLVLPIDSNVLSEKIMEIQSSSIEHSVKKPGFFSKSSLIFFPSDRTSFVAFA